MVVQKKTKKKKQKVSFRKLPKFNWTTQKKKAALLIAEGIYNYGEIAREVEVSDRSLRCWREYPEFRNEVDRLTFLQEEATRAGIVRKAIKALKVKERTIEDDRSTYLDYLEFILKTIPPDVKEDEDKLKDLADAIMNSAKAIGK